MITLIISLSAAKLRVFLHRSQGVSRESAVSEEKVNEVAETVCDAFIFAR